MKTLPSNVRAQTQTNVVTNRVLAVCTVNCEIPDVKIDFATYMNIRDTRRRSKPITDFVCDSTPQ
jgi:hypothetical protein